MTFSQNNLFDSGNLASDSAENSEGNMSSFLHVDNYRGAAFFSIPLKLPYCRELRPLLDLSYHSFSKNSSFGVGFTIPLESIERDLSRKIPDYDENDIFTFSNQNLLQSGTPREIKEENYTYKVYSYRSYIQGIFACIEQWVEQSERVSHWRLTDQQGGFSLYGQSPLARVYDPSDQKRVLSWLLQERIDYHGNKIVYNYRSSGIENIKGGSRCLERISYGFFKEEEKDLPHFEVVFDYGENSFKTSQIKAYSASPYKAFERKDIFYSFKSGFTEKTEILCKTIRVFHRFKELGKEPQMVRAFYFDYDENPSLSYLRAFKETGYIAYKGKLRKKETPTMIFSYETIPNEKGKYIFSLSQLLLKENQALSTWFLSLIRTHNGSFSQEARAFKKDENHWMIKENISSLSLMREGDYWCVYDKSDHEKFREISIEGSEILSKGEEWDWIDLYQEGLAGILYNDHNGQYYLEPQGGGSWAGAECLKNFPLLKKGVFVSLEANGALDYLITEEDYAGYHSFDVKDHQWGPFVSFPHFPGELNQAFKEQAHVDVNGDGRADFLLLGEKQLKVYLSKGKKGYDVPFYEKLPADFPLNPNYSQQVFVGFAEVFADGKSHRILIENGKFECWPNLGHGKFGEKIILKNAPYFKEGLHVKSLYLVDIDGSGTTDLIYVRKNHLEVFFNQSGRCFSEALCLELPIAYYSLVKLSFADLKGNGTKLLVLTYAERGKMRHLCYDFCAGKKPHLLTQIDNNKGGFQRIHYASSTKFYMQDKKEGIHRLTSLPFALEVVEKTEYLEAINLSLRSSRYTYHHGAYDVYERKFCGFGYVEQFDDEEFLEYKQGDYMAPVHSKTWFHIGLYEYKKQMYKTYKKEFYKKNQRAASLVYHHFHENTQSIGAQKKAFRALSGQLLRQEIYANDKGPLKDHPYSVVEFITYIRTLEAQEEKNACVFLSYTGEVLKHHYERDPRDPRIAHDFLLEVDDFGYLLQKVSLVYSRCVEAAYPEQKKNHFLLTRQEYIGQCESFSLSGIPSYSVDFEIGGFSLKAGCYADFQQIKKHVSEALTNTILFEQTLTHSRPEARILRCQRHFYWNEPQSQSMPLGKSGPKGLLHHREQMAFTSMHIKDIFKDKIFPENKTLEVFLSELMYKREGEAYWMCGDTQYYHKGNQYFLPWKSVKPNGMQEEIQYDIYSLLPLAKIVKENEYTDQEYKIAFVNHYAYLRAIKQTDMNHLSSYELLLDPLSEIVAESVYGYENAEIKGDLPLEKYLFKESEDFQEMLDNSQEYLQQATSFFYRDNQSWQRENLPLRSIFLTRETHVSELAEGKTSFLRKTLIYSDSLGRALQSKSFTTHQGWLCSEHVLYSVKGLIVKRYKPIYSDTHLYQRQESEDQSEKASVFYYDPLYRNIRFKNAKGFFTKVNFSPWQKTTYDENDTVKDSKYYKLFMDKWQKANQETKKTLCDEKEILDKAAAHYDTPMISCLDGFGRSFLKKDFLKQKENDKAQALLNHLEMDIQGNELSQADARLYSKNKKNFIYTHTMSCRVKILSADAGELWQIPDAMSRFVVRWDGKNTCILNKFDTLGRLERIVVSNPESGLVNHVSERFFYGKKQEDKALNNYGRLIAHFHSGGLYKIEKRSFKGEILEFTRILTQAYKSSVNWKDLNGVNAKDTRLQKEFFASFFKYQATGRCIEQTDPKGHVQRHNYDLLGRLQSIGLRKAKNQPEKLYIKKMLYNSKGQRLEITYGNEVSTSYLYDEVTFKLSSIKSYKENKLFQELYYNYDPVGNIVSIDDKAYETMFSQSSCADLNAPKRYSYDSLYRLIQAEGRAHSEQLTREIVQSAAGLFDGQAISRYNEVYEYDLAGNLTKVRHTSKNSFTQEFSIDENSNRAIKISADALEELQDEDSVKRHYDVNGNLRKTDNIQAMCWNERNELSRVDLTDHENDSEYYLYGSLGARLRKVHLQYKKGVQSPLQLEKIYLDSLQIQRTYQGDNILNEDLSITMGRDSELAVCHYYLNKTEDQASAEGKDLYALTDHLGSVSMELDEKAQLVGYREFFPFGKTALRAFARSGEKSPMSYYYSGKEFDELTGFYYYGARYYVPGLARWINPDPLGAVDDLNLYAFVSDNPVNLKDLDGRMFMRYPSDPYQKFRDHFQAGDKIYGLSLDRIEYIDIAYEKVGKGHNLTIDQLNKHFLGVKLLARVGLVYYDKETLLKKNSEELDFKNYLESHSKYNPLKVPGIEEEIRMKEALIRVGRACKAGIEFTIEKKHRKVHFVLDGIDQSSIPQKIHHHQLPTIGRRSPEFIKTLRRRNGGVLKDITGQELRYIYRNWDRFQGKVLFWKEGHQIIAPWQDIQQVNFYKRRFDKSIEIAGRKAIRDIWKNHYERKDLRQGLFQNFNFIDVVHRSLTSFL